MTELKASMLLAPSVLDDPYDFYRRLRENAPVWAVPGTDVVAISSFALLSEAVARTEDFSSTMQCLIYRDENGLPARLDFSGAALPTLATADLPCTPPNGVQSFQSWSPAACAHWRATSMLLPRRLSKRRCRTILLSSWVRSETSSRSR